MIILSCAYFFLLSQFSPCFAKDNSKYGGQIVISSSGDPKSFNPILAKETSTSTITGLIFEGLTTVDPTTMKVIPNLAERWEVSEDGLTWTFYLRPNIFWNDGEKVTADDVVFTFNELIFNPDIPSSARDIFTIDGKIFKVEKVDDTTIRFVLPVRFAPFLRGLSQEILPKHKLEKFVQEKRFNFVWGIDSKPEDIVGSGPFRLQKYQPGQRVILEVNPYYWKKSQEGEKLPYLNRIVFLIVPNMDLEMLKFMEGTVDFYSLRGMDYGLLKPLEKKRDFTIYNLGPDTGSNFLVFNQNPDKNPKTGKSFVDPIKLKWFSNINFRRALAHAIDKQRMIEIVKYGLGYPQDAEMEEGSGFFHNPNVTKYDFDLNKAKDLLTRAGFIDRNGDGFREDSDGNTVQFTLLTNADNSERVDLAGIVRHDLEEVGLKVNFQPVEFNTLVAKLTSTFEWDAIVLGLTGGVEPHFGKNVWASDGQLHMWHPHQESPATTWEKRIDELFTLGVSELDDNKRKVYYDEFQQILSDELPMIYTVLSAKIVALRNRFGNLKPCNNGGVLHNLEEIYVLPNKK